MPYFVKIDDNPEAKSLMKKLKSLPFVTIVEKITPTDDLTPYLNAEGHYLSVYDFRKIISVAESGATYTAKEAKQISEKWKNQNN